MHANARLYAGLLDGDESGTLALDPTRKAYVHLVCGQLEVNGQTLHTGDALGLQSESKLKLSHGHAAEVLVFDLAP